MKFTSRIYTAGLMMLGACSCACAGPAPKNSTVAASSSVAKATTPMQPMAFKMNTVAGNVSYQYDGAPQLGKPLGIVLHIQVGQATTVEFRPDNGLALANPQALRLAAGQEITHRLTVTPTQEGLMYVGVFVHQGTKTGTSSIPVEVGQVLLKQAGKISETPAGERVISMPAQ